MSDVKREQKIAKKWLLENHAMRACIREEVIEHWISCWKKASYEKVFVNSVSTLPCGRAMTKKESYKLLLLDCFGIDVTQS